MVLVGTTTSDPVYTLWLVIPKVTLLEQIRDLEIEYNHISLQISKQKFCVWWEGDIDCITKEKSKQKMFKLWEILFVWKIGAEKNPWKPLIYSD